MDCKRFLEEFIEIYRDISRAAVFVISQIQRLCKQTQNIHFTVSKESGRYVYY
jgi:arginine decarboxylase-like protein